MPKRPRPANVGNAESKGQWRPVTKGKTAPTAAPPVFLTGSLKDMPPPTPQTSASTVGRGGLAHEGFAPRPRLATPAPKRNLVSPGVCQRCSGAGFMDTLKEYNHISGLCFRCHGDGWQETDPIALARDEADRARRKSARLAATQSQRERRRMEQQATKAARDYDRAHRDTHAALGLEMLQVLEPHRHRMAVRNMESRTDEVCAALNTYAADHLKQFREQLRA